MSLKEKYLVIILLLIYIFRIRVHIITYWEMLSITWKNMCFFNSFFQKYQLSYPYLLSKLCWHILSQHATTPNWRVSPDPCYFLNMFLIFSKMKKNVRLNTKLLVSQLKFLELLQTLVTFSMHQLNESDRRFLMQSCQKEHEMTKKGYMIIEQNQLTPTKQPARPRQA